MTLASRHHWDHNFTVGYLLYSLLDAKDIDLGGVGLIAEPTVKPSQGAFRGCFFESQIEKASMAGVRKAHSLPPVRCVS